jgi:CubicO group peptidase (beta-lactamase class C family)
MADLGIDDCEPKLSDTEKKATVRMLLQARSGIYHPAHAETESMKRAKPARHSHEPGSFWYYNNWDFNALGTIFMQETEKDLFDELRTRIAEPLGFEDYDPKRNVYRPTKESPISIHAAYPMVLSCRDMARFGLLYLRKGRWGDKQIVPESWVDETFKPHSPRYGYMWWISQNGRPFPNLKVDGAAYSANGNKGHYILIVPSIRMVFVGRPDLPKERSGADFGKLVQMVLDARTN